jgi:ribonuclease P protein component
MSTLATLGLTKAERLCARKAIDAVVAQGHAVHEAPFRLVGSFMDLPTTYPAQIAFSVPKRYMPLAVQRNRMKRLMREAYRLHKHRWYQALDGKEHECAWLLIYQSRTPLPWAKVEGTMTRLFDRWLAQHA